MTASFELDARHGGRLSSFAIGGQEILCNEERDVPLAWGAYPMTPYAGRVDHGRFGFDGVEYSLPIGLGEHAIHGIGFVSEWTEVSPTHLRLDLDDRWPLGGTVDHHASISDHGATGTLQLQLTITAAEFSMPAMVGWHPWFRKQLLPGAAAAQILVPGFHHAQMYEVGDDSIPTGVLVSPPDPGPWDHPFRRMQQPIVIEWPDQLRLSLSSTCDHWVIYDQPANALCVEPQSGPPNIFNPERFDIEPDVLAPGQALTHIFTLAWKVLT